MLDEGPQESVPLFEREAMDSGQLQEHSATAGDRHAHCPSYPTGLHIIAEEVIAPADSDRQAGRLSCSYLCPQLQERRSFLLTPQPGALQPSQGGRGQKASCHPLLKLREHLWGDPSPASTKLMQQRNCLAQRNVGEHRGIA